VLRSNNRHIIPRFVHPARRPHAQQQRRFLRELRRHWRRRRPPDVGDHLRDSVQPRPGPHELVQRWFWLKRRLWLQHRRRRRRQQQQQFPIVLGGHQQYKQRQQLGGRRRFVAVVVQHELVEHHQHDGGAASTAPASPASAPDASQAASISQGQGAHLLRGCRVHCPSNWYVYVYNSDEHLNCNNLILPILQNPAICDDFSVCELIF
jgi:hypothetical protein